ncbi:hypothetical protein BDV97DRAFT_366697 [Delphinella strobiligena]|nr:hypothetical protein BDV97DRAFT_366697 [Delphinella strobiligena]
MARESISPTPSPLPHKRRGQGPEPKGRQVDNGPEGGYRARGGCEGGFPVNVKTSSSSKPSVRFHETVASKSYCQSQEPRKTGEVDVCNVPLDDTKDWRIWHRTTLALYREERKERHIRTQVEQVYWKTGPRDHDSFPECSGIVPRSILGIWKRSWKSSESEKPK